MLKPFPTKVLPAERTSLRPDLPKTRHEDWPAPQAPTAQPSQKPPRPAIHKKRRASPVTFSAPLPHTGFEFGCSTASAARRDSLAASGLDVPLCALASLREATLLKTSRHHPIAGFAFSPSSNSCRISIMTPTRLIACFEPAFISSALIRYLFAFAKSLRLIARFADRK